MLVELADLIGLMLSQVRHLPPPTEGCVHRCGLFGKREAHHLFTNLRR